MILDIEQIKNIILKRPNQALISAGQKYSKELRKHFYGFGREQMFETINGYEKPTLRELRVKYAKSNKDLMSRLTRPVDKVFSARGGSIYYNLPEGQDKKARSLASDVKGGVSIKKWIENVWRAHYLDDPNGIIFMEITSDRTEAVRLKQAGKSFVYPTYKDINVIYDYLPNESFLEYVVFKVDDAEKIQHGLSTEKDREIFRVVDDAFDRYVMKQGDQVTEIPGFTMPNYFNRVPAITNSDLSDPVQHGAKLSLVDTVIEIANEFLLTGSIKISHKFMHGFPKYWEYADDCPTCDGTGDLNGEKCPECLGTTKRLITKMSDAKMLSYPQDKETPIITPQVAGYVEPSKIYYEIATHDLQMLENYMSYTLWGTASVQQPQGMSMDGAGEAQTATQVMNEIKPQSDRLTVISQCGESRHKFVLDSIIQIQIQLNYPGSSVNYGQRYMLEGPDDLWKKYSDARKAGASDAILDGLLMEYYEATYFNDPVELAIKIKLIQVEPSVHATVSEVKNLGYEEEYMIRKMYFGDWKRSLSQGQLIAANVDVLKLTLIDYVKDKSLPQLDEEAGAPGKKKLLPA